MSKLIWSGGLLAELSQLLTHSTLHASTEIGGATIYHLDHDGQEKIAISLPQGKALFITTSYAGDALRRRRDEQFKPPS